MQDDEAIKKNVFAMHWEDQVKVAALAAVFLTLVYVLVCFPTAKGSIASPLWAWYSRRKVDKLKEKMLEQEKKNRREPTWRAEQGLERGRVVC